MRCREGLIAARATRRTGWSCREQRRRELRSPAQPQSHEQQSHEQPHLHRQKATLPLQHLSVGARVAAVHERQQRVRTSHNVSPGSSQGAASLARTMPAHRRSAEAQPSSGHYPTRAIVCRLQRARRLRKLYKRGLAVWWLSLVPRRSTVPRDGCSEHQPMPQFRRQQCRVAERQEQGGLPRPCYTGASSE